MSKLKQRTASNVPRAILVTLAIILMVALMLPPALQGGAGHEMAYAETASSHSLVLKAGKVHRYDADGSRHVLSEDVLGVNGEMAFCMDPNVNFKAGTVSSHDILSVVSQSQLNEMALRAHYVLNVFQDASLSYNARVILAQTLVWEVLSPSQSFFVVPAEDGGSFPEVTTALRDEVCEKARSFAVANITRYEGYGTLWKNGATQPVATIGCRLVVGNIDITKCSSNPSASNGNRCYSLEGAVYGVYGDSSCSLEACRLTTDASGYAKSPELHVGEYYVREIAAPVGFALDATTYQATVIGGETTHAGGNSVCDSPLVRADIATLRKHDGEIGWPNLPGASLGSAALADAKYVVEHYSGIYETPEEAIASGSPLKRWEFATDAEGAIDLSHPDDFLVSGELYRNDTGDAVFPLGTYVISESSPSEGYLLSKEAFTVKVRQDGNDAVMEGASIESAQGDVIPAAEQVMRCDLSLTKVRESDMTRLAGIPFTLTSETTGESHVLVTDDNGRIDTTSCWNPHTKDTNSNDAALRDNGIVDENMLDPSAGVWFGQSPSGEATQAIDALGALPYDTYTLEELPCSSNVGLVLVKMEGIRAKRDAVTIDLGTVDDKDSPLPTIATVAYDATDMDKSVSGSSRATVKDDVELTGLVPGRTYRLYGTVIDAETGLPALAGSGFDGVAEAAQDEDPGEFEDDSVQAFWDGLVDLLGAKRLPTIEGISYEMASDRKAEMDSINQYLAENEAISSRMIVASREFEAESPQMVTALDYEMDASELDGAYVIYDLLVADDGTMAIHADTENEQESFNVEQPTPEAVGKGYYKTGGILGALEGPFEASGLLAAGTVAGSCLFVGYRRFGGWNRA